MAGLHPPEKRVRQYEEGRRGRVVREIEVGGHSNDKHQ